MKNPREFHRLVVRAILWGYAVLSLLGFFGFVLEKSTSVTPPLKGVPWQRPSADVNLAYYPNGTWVEASSFGFLYLHHPLFVIDGRKNPPNRLEEWVPDRRTDAEPFLAVHLARPADIREVVVSHERRYSERYYRVSCVRDGRELESLNASVSGPTEVTYPLRCQQADAVRLDFAWDPYDPEGHIRIFEIEVWGR